LSRVRKIGQKPHCKLRTCVWHAMAAMPVYLHAG
jgi:hypothetical protein